MAKLKIADMTPEYRLQLRQMYMNAPESGMFEVEEVAIYYGISLSQLQYWRTNGGGPKFKKIGRTIFYEKGDLVDYFSNKYENTAQYEAIA
jgi:uncharacterized protein YjcR